jgi:catechol-2,3-dioxygenase
VELFHYHLVTSRVREVEARYLAKLGFSLVARYGRVEDEHRGYEPGV